MPKQNGNSGTEQIDATMADTALQAPAGMKFKDVMTLVDADGVEYDLAGVTVDDADGDATLPNSGTVSGFMTATWYNNDVKITNLDQELSPCGGPYKLEITVKNVIAKTSYGAPNENDYGSHLGKTYTFKPTNMKICYIQPSSMHVDLADGGVGENSYFPTTGYNPSVWEANKGFSIDLMNKAGKNFPTTGFKNAEFNLLGSGGDQSKYRCIQTAGGSQINLSDAPASTAVGKGCTITFAIDSEPTSDITVKMEYDNGSSWDDIGSYTMNSVNKWFRYVGEHSLGGSGGGQLGTLHALIACGAPDDSVGYNSWKDLASVYFYAPSDFTNVPNAQFAVTGHGSNGITRWVEVNTYRKHRIVRDIDNTLLGEWGVLRGHYQFNSSAFSSVWTSELFAGTGYPFAVNVYPTVGGTSAYMYWGRVIYENPTTSIKYVTFCRN